MKNPGDRLKILDNVDVCLMATLLDFSMLCADDGFGSAGNTITRYLLAGRLNKESTDMQHVLEPLVPISKSIDPGLHR